MNWFECTKVVSYYLWEHTGCENALGLWYAAEDIAAFFEQTNILDTEMVNSIKRLGLGSEGYIWFVRNIAYRLYIYTNNHDDIANWYLAEQLLNNPAWLQNLTAMAAMLNSDIDNVTRQMRSDMIRSFYDPQTF